MSHYLRALYALAGRYRLAFRTAWQARSSLVPLDRTAAELAFLPSVLELTDSPASPAPQLAMRITQVLLIISLLWAAFGRLDIVAVASGRVVPDSRTKTIQALETATVRDILVADGALVRKGQPLLRLDAVGVTSDYQKAVSAIRASRLTASRTAAQVRAIDLGYVEKSIGAQGATEAELEDARRLAVSEFVTYQEKVGGLRSAVAQKAAEKKTAQQSIQALQDYANIASARVADYERLLVKNYVSRQEYLMREQERISAQRDLDTQRNRLVELSAGVNVAEQDLATTVSETRRTWLEEQRQAASEADQLAAELAKTQERSTSMNLISPVDGTVQALAVHTVGGVVTSAQPLMSIVPLNDTVEVEATVLNKDVGFVRPGQTVVIKVESFPYTRYGYVKGFVISVSQDAVKDDKLGLVYPARMRVDHPDMNIDGAKIRLRPGMALTTEIKTGKRTVLEYLLDPIRIHLNEAMRER